MKLLTYHDMKITCIRPPVEPNRLVQLACTASMRQRLDIPMKTTAEELISYLVNANHLNPIEHVHFTFQIENVSRSFLAQITRHRMASYITSSQHYQDYRDYPMIVEGPMNRQSVELHLDQSLAMYKYLVDDCQVPPEEARQILPNACAVNIIMTIDARNLMNLLNLRMCNRNVKEMRIFATRLYNVVFVHWPEFAVKCGPDCRVGTCRQGKMRCKEGFYERLS